MNVIGFLAGLLTLLTYVPQTFKTIRSRQTRDLSLVTLLLLSLSALLWVIYGVGKDLAAVWATNSVVLALGSALLIIKLQNRRGGK